MKKVIKNIGQIGLGTLFGVGASMLAALIGGFFTQNRFVESKIDAVKKDQIEVVQRVSSLEANTLTMKEDIREIKSDLKEVLKRLR